MQAIDDLALLSGLVEKAGDVALNHFRRKLDIWDKGDGLGPVTEADFAVDGFLREAFATRLPGAGWLSEESGTAEERADKETVLIIDPIDGTRAFIDGSEDWAISVALTRAGEVTAGVVYMPAKGRLYSAARGAGATINGTPIQTSEQAEITKARILTTKPNLKPEFWAGGRPPAFERSFRSSLAYRLCLVAEGRYDAMITLRPTWEWDVAAGLLIVEEAGGTGSDGNGRRPAFNNPHPQIAGTIAGGAVHKPLIAARSGKIELPGTFTPPA